MIELKIETLYQAIEKKTRIRLKRTSTAENEFPFSSRFLGFQKEAKAIIIDFPTFSYESDPLKKGNQIVVHFIHRESPFIFYSNVLGLTDYKATGNQGIHAMKIAQPGTILSEERRDFLKVSTPALPVEIKLIESVEKVKQLQDIRYKAVTVNISGGGVAVQDQEGKLRLIRGDILSLKIHLPDETVHMEGEVVNIYQFKNSRKLIFGIKYMQRDIDKLSCKRNVKTIIRYVMRRERELLCR